jgi:class 3 adenylate cyclase
MAVVVPAGLPWPELRRKLGDDAAGVMRREPDRLLRDAVLAHGGTEMKGTGDGLVVVFDSAADGRRRDRHAAFVASSVPANPISR